MTTAIQAIVTIQNDQPTTTSKNIADVFGKRHDHVLRAIDNLLLELPEEHRPNFGETVNYRENPSGGEPIASRNFTITRDGFTLLAMGFTGKKALAFKLAYIDQFNAMEATIKHIEHSAPTKGLFYYLKETIMNQQERKRPTVPIICHTTVL